MLKRILYTFLILFSSVLNLKGQAQQVDGILAVVGDKIVMRSEFETELANLVRVGEPYDTSTVNCLIFRKLIERKLLLNQAEEDSIELTDERIESEIDNRWREYVRRAGSEADLERYLGQTQAEYKEYIRPKMREQLLIREMESKITANIKISPQEVKEFFDTIPKDSVPLIPTEVEIAQLILEAPVSSAAREFARMQLENLRRRIIAGEEFENLAVAYSEDPGSREQGGLLPEFGRGDMVPEFERVAFKLKPDSLSQVFESSFGFHIIKLIQRKGEKVLARHILIRPQNTTSDYVVVSRRADSIYTALTRDSASWCNIVKKYLAKEYGDKGTCGFVTDQTTGSTKVIFEALPTDIKMVIEKMQPGEYSRPAPIKTPDGRTVYRIIYLRSFVAPHEANLTQDYGRIQLEAESLKKQLALEAWVNKTRKVTYIRINSNYLNCPDIVSWQN